MNENIYDLFDKVDKDVNLDEHLDDTVSDELRESMGWPPYEDISVASKEDISKNISSFDEWVNGLEREDLYSILSGKDNINHPNHYKTKSGLEAIDVIKAFTEDLKGVEAVDTANIIKYICRWKKKNGLEDLKKAQWYLNDLIKTVEGDK